MDLKKKNLKKANDPGQRKLSNLLALDFASSGLKAVRLKKVKDRIVLSAADILPAVNVDAGDHPDLPKPLSAYYTSLCANTKDVNLRVFNHALQDSDDLEAVISDNMNVSPDYRIAGRILLEGKGKRESSILGVAVPENFVGQHLDLFSVGAPAPHSFELSGLAAFSAFLFNCGKETANQTVCLIEAGHSHTYVAFLHHNRLQVVNRFDVGGKNLQQQVKVALGVDEEMASTILSGGSVDVAEPVRKALSPLTKQLSIYREYVERLNKTTLSGLYMSGGEANSSYWQAAVQQVLGLEPVIWNPFEKIDGVEEAYPEQLKGQESRFAAAVGAALAGMEAV